MLSCERISFYRQLSELGFCFMCKGLIAETYDVIFNIFQYQNYKFICAIQLSQCIKMCQLSGLKFS